MSVNKKALFFVNSPKGGGAEKACLTLAKTLSSKNIKSIFITTYYEEFIWPSYIENYCLRVNKYISNLSNNKTWNLFLKRYQHTHFELISAHLPMSWKIALHSPWVEDCLYVVHNKIEGKHFSTFYINKLISNNLLDKKIGFVSDGLNQWFCKKYLMNSNKTFTLYNPIEIVRDNKTKSVCNNKYLLCIGRLCDQKNQELAIRLYANLSLNNEYKLVIAGEGKSKNKLVSLCNKYGIQEKVFFVDYLDNPYRAISEANLLLSTSKYEGFNMTLAEAIMCKTPVISSDCEFGPNEILTGESSIYLYLIDHNGNPKDFQSTVNLIKQTLQNPKSYVFPNIEKYNPENVIDNYFIAYNE